MNIRFKNIKIENFRSLQQADVNFENQGIVIVKGINEYEDKATSNGSGKSSIFEAIVYALFEETSSGEKDVANRIINQGFNIILNFDIDNESYTIIRKNDGKKSDVTLLKNNEDISARNKTDTNKLILQILSINKNIFLDSVFLSQNISTNLASLQPTGRKERLEILTNTDNIINNFKSKLKDDQIKHEAEYIRLTTNKNVIEGQIQSNQQQLDIYQNTINEINKQIEYKNSLGNIEEINNNIDKIQSNIKQYKNDLTVQDQKIENSQSEINKLQNDNKQFLEIKTKLSNEKADLEKELNNIENNLKLNSNKRVQFENFIENENNEITKIQNSDTCPTCGRKLDNINEDHIKSVIAEYSKKITEYENEIANLLKESNDLQQQKIEQEKLINNKQDEINNNENNLNQFKETENTLEIFRQKLIQEKNQINTEINNFEQQLQEQQKLKDTIQNIQIGNKSEFEELLNNTKLKIEKHLNEQKKLEENCNNEDININIIKHCQQLVTKDFRTYLLKNSIDYLNNLLEQYSKDLFSNNQDRIFITNDDSKLDIMLGNATYESLSGGEKTRVNIALLLAQKSLANIIGNLTCNIIILDEVLGYCDTVAEENVINLLTKELNSLETIFMISHKEISIGYDSQLTIIKGKDGLSNVREG